MVEHKEIVPYPYRLVIEVDFNEHGVVEYSDTYRVALPQGYHRQRRVKKDA